MKMPRLPLVTRVAFVYVLIGGAWFLLSDRLVAAIFSDPRLLTIAQTYKDWLFVVITGLILLAYVGRENKLRRSSEENLSDIFENSTEGIFESSLDGTLIRVNPAMARICGYDSPEEMVSSETGTGWADLAPDGRGEEFIDRVLHDGEATAFEAHLRRKNSSLIWTSINARVVRDRSGNAIRVDGFVNDVTARKNRERALRDSEIDHRRLVDESPYATAIQSDGLLLYINEAGAKLLGASNPQELHGVALVDFVHEEMRSWVPERLAALEQGRSVPPFEARLLRRDGSCIVVEVSAFPITYLDRPGAQVFMRDLTAQKAAEDALRMNEERLRAIVDNTQNIYYSHSPDHSLTYVSQQVQVLLGYSPAELAHGWQDLVTDHPINQRGADLSQKAIDSGMAQEPYVLELHAKDGAHVWVEVRETPVVREGKTVAVVGALTDITERKHTDENLEHRLAELTVLHSVAIAGSQSQSEDELIARTTQIVSGMLYPDDAGVYLLDESGSQLTPHASYWGAAYPESRRPVAMSEGVIGSAAASGKPVRINDVTQETGRGAASSGIRSELCVPIRLNECIIGVFNVESRKLSAFDAKDERVLTTIADTLGSAIERIRLLTTEQHRRQEAELLREATAALTRTLDLERLFNIILKSLAALMPYSTACIELIDDDQSEIVAAEGTPESRQLVGRRYPRQRGADGNGRKPVIVPDVRKAPDFRNFGLTANIRSAIAVPMFVQEQRIGELHLTSTELDFYSEEHAAVLQTFSNQAAVAIQNARLFQEEKRRSRIIETLADIANEISATPVLNDLLDHVAQRALDLLNASHLVIFLVQNDNVTVKPVAARGSYSRELLSHAIKVGEGITGSIIASGRAEIVNDTPGDPRTVRVPGTPKEDGMLETMMSAPLTLRDRTIGAINAWRLRADGLFNQSELNFLISIAHQTSISIALTRVLQETIQRAEEAAAIAEVGRDISATLQLDLVLDRIATYAKDLLDAETSAVYLFQRADSRLHAVAAKGLDSDELKNDPVELGSGLSGIIALNKRGEIVNYDSSDPRAVVVKGTEVNPVEHLMGVPVLNNDQLTGLLVVWRTGVEQEFQPAELNFLTGLAQQAAVAIENARLFQLEQERRQEAENLQVAATAVASSLDLQQVLQTIMIALKHVIPYDSASMLLLEGDHVRLRAAQGLPKPEMALNQLFSSSNALLHAIHLSGKPVILSDAQKDPRFEAWAGGEGTHGWLGVPLIARGEVIGYITLDSKTLDAFRDKDAILAQTFAHQAAAAIDNARLYSGLEQANRELSRAYDTTLEGWGNALELRDKETQGHTRRVADLTLRLGRQLGLEEPELTHLRRGVLVHDIGKMGVSDEILHKETSLTKKEWDEMRKHPQYAFDLLYPIPYLRSALTVAYCHHERWNGSGYPRGLSGEEIPLPARIFAVVDVWDALLSDRPYRKAWPRTKVLDYLNDQAGILFDPKVVQTFLKMVEADTAEPAAKPA
jgi:PAS domain S-box-containing protein